MMSYQRRVSAWLEECFGRESAAEPRERAFRFVEEAIELAQASGCSRGEVAQLLDYVYGRAGGQIAEEAGGVLVTLAGLCQAHGVDMQASGEAELLRNEARTDALRAKRDRRPPGSPLPQ